MPDPALTQIYVNSYQFPCSAPYKRAPHAVAQSSCRVDAPLPPPLQSYFAQALLHYQHRLISERFRAVSPLSTPVGCRRRESSPFAMVAVVGGWAVAFFENNVCVAYVALKKT